MDAVNSTTLRQSGRVQDTQAAMATQNSQNKSPAAFTPEMRDRQARGKDPYLKVETSEESDSSDDDPITLGLGAYVPSLMPFLLLVSF